MKIPYISLVFCLLFSVPAAQAVGNSTDDFSSLKSGIFQSTVLPAIRMQLEMSIYEKLSNRITWNEFLKLSKDTEKRQQVSSNLDEQEAKLFLDNRNTPINLSFQNSFPNYGEF